MDVARPPGLYADGGGEGGPLLLLLHGLGATAAIWSSFLADVGRRWPGRWLAPDLPGHGASEPLRRYTLGDYAAALEPLLAGEREVVAVGHSMGGAIALELASGLRVAPPAAVFALGVKVDWSAPDLTRLADLSSRPPKAFDTLDAARAFGLRACGLDTAAEPALIRRGLREVDGQWQMAMDPAAFAIEAPNMPRLLSMAGCPTHLACGSGDAMVTVDRLRTLDPAATEIDGAGHNAMVDRPEAIWAWIDRCH